MIEPCRTEKQLNSSLPLGHISRKYCLDWQVLVSSFNDLVADDLPDPLPISKWEWGGMFPEESFCYRQLDSSLFELCHGVVKWPFTKSFTLASNKNWCNGIEILKHAYLKSIIEQQSSKASHVETAQSYKSKDLVHQSLTTRVKQPLHFNLRWRPEVDSQEIIFLSFSGVMANHVFHTILQCHKCSPKYKHQ